jgi:hypothetical protein
VILHWRSIGKSLVNRDQYRDVIATVNLVSWRIPANRRCHARLWGVILMRSAERDQ